MKSHRISLVVATLVAAATPSSGAEPLSLELRAVVACTPGAPMLIDPASGAAICFSSDVIIDRSDVVDARKIPLRSDEDAVRITVDADAATRLAAATTAAAGTHDRIGVLYDGQIISLPLVLEPVTGGELEITGWPNDAVDAVVVNLRLGKRP